MGQIKLESAVREVLGRVRRGEESQSESRTPDFRALDDAVVRALAASPDDGRSLRPVFIGGCPRSGTTLVGAMLGIGPAQLTVPEAQFKWTLLEGTDDQGRLDLGWAVAHLRRDWRFQLWRIELGRPASNGTRVRYAALLQAFVRAYGATVGKPEPAFWIDHTPANVRHALRLNRVLPGARFVNLVRDGRAVAASVIPLDWGPNNVFEAARWWAAEVAMGLAAADRLGSDTVATLRYEDVVHGRLAPLANACVRFGLTFSESMTAAREYTVQPYTAEQHRFVSREPLRGRADAWRTELRPRDIETFEYLTGDLLGFLGYDLDYEGRARPPRKQDHVADATMALIRRQFDKVRRLARRRRQPRFGRSQWNRRPRP